MQLPLTPPTHWWEVLLWFPGAAVLMLIALRLERAPGAESDDSRALGCAEAFGLNSVASFVGLAALFAAGQAFWGALGLVGL